MNYVNKGFKYDNDLNYSDEDIAVKGNAKVVATTHYVELPLNIAYKLNGSSGGFSFGAGPVIGVGLSGDAKFTGEGSINDDPQQKVSEKANIVFDGDRNAADDDLYLKRLEFGANIFAGYELENGLRFSIQARPDFNNLIPCSKQNGDFPNYKNTYFAVNIGPGF